MFLCPWASPQIPPKFSNRQIIVSYSLKLVINRAGCNPAHTSEMEKRKMLKSKNNFHSMKVVFTFQHLSFS